MVWCQTPACPTEPDIARSAIFGYQYPVLHMQWLSTLGQLFSRRQIAEHALEIYHGTFASALFVPLPLKKNECDLSIQ